MTMNRAEYREAVARERKLSRSLSATAACLALAFYHAPVVAANAVDPSVTLSPPSGKTRVIDFTVDQGTQMSVDISADGKWIIFDLLGHIYRIPAEGGDAECLTQNSGPALNFHPRFSPDGSEIAFISDRSGQQNLWIMTADGKDVRNVNPDLDARYQQPAWSPDGKKIYVRRAEQIGFISNSAIWAFPASGGEGEVIRRRRETGAPRPSRGRDIEFFAPTPSPDGQSLYYTVLYPVTAALATPREASFYIQKHDLNTGDIAFLREQHTVAVDPEEGTIFGVEVPGSEEKLGSVRRTVYGDEDFQPEVSPDGRSVAYVRRVVGTLDSFRGHEYGPRNALFIRDLETGAERQLVESIQLDLARNFSVAIYGQPILPRYSWTKDGGSIIFSDGGGIRRVNVKTGEVKSIPFKARVLRVISEQVRGKVDIADESFPIHLMRWAASSPDNLKLVFEAAGDLWITDLPNGAPRLLAPDLGSGVQATPSWSPDGQWIAFTTWHAETGGHVWKIPAAGGNATRLTKEAGRYIYPVWSPDGATIAVNRQDPVTRSDASAKGLSPSSTAWRIYTMPNSGGKLDEVHAALAERAPHFGTAGNLFVETEEGRLTSIDRDRVPTDGTVRLKAALNTIYSADLARSAMPTLSPDGRRVAYVLEEKVYVAFLGDPADKDRPLEVVVDGRQLDPNCIADQPGEQCLTSLKGGLYPRWRDATTLEFMNGTTHVVYDASAGSSSETLISLNIQRPKLRGRIALTGAKLITLAGNEIIEGGDIVVEGRRIVCVGTCDTKDADQILDVSGKVIAPGFVDSHGHQGRSRVAQPATLAYGITTTTELVDWGGGAIVMSQMLDAGKILGPRMFSVGSPPRDSTEEGQAFHTLEQARALVDRRLAMGASYIKIYQFSPRWKFALLNQAARERGVTVTGGHDGLNELVSWAIEGMPGWEHKPSIEPVYRDFAEFMGLAKLSYSLTSVTSSKHYHRSRHNLLADEKYRRFMPSTIIQRDMDESTLANDGRVPNKSAFTFPIIAQGAADIVRAGGFVTIGEHGEEAGIADHWEMWDLAEALTPLETLRAATLHGARWLGIEHETGSLVAGKLADLVVFNSDPLEDIHNTIDLAYVMKAGVLYRADTLDELWPENREYRPSTLTGHQQQHED